MNKRTCCAALAAMLIGSAADLPQPQCLFLRASCGSRTLSAVGSANDFSVGFSDGGWRGCCICP